MDEVKLEELWTDLLRCDVSRPHEPHRWTETCWTSRGEDYTASRYCDGGAVLTDPEACEG